jgi:hypothetical protein
MLIPLLVRAVVAVLLGLAVLRGDERIGFMQI